jgi:hypothetical protein
LRLIRANLRIKCIFSPAMENFLNSTANYGISGRMLIRWLEKDGSDRSRIKLKESRS